MAKILIVDDDRRMCLFLSEVVDRMGHETSTANTLEEGLKAALGNDYDLVLLDLEFPEGNGLEILPELLKAPSKPEVIIVTGTGDSRGAELTFKCGAWDYVQKPFVFHEVSLPITRALQYREERGISKIPVHLKREAIFGASPAIESSLELVAKGAITDASVLITGETGTGKELFAMAIHENSRRATGHFIPVDCGALPETLVESTLFGHEKGVYTGAEKTREGLVVQAEGGTLFLDEIGDLPLIAQKTLLRTLQEKRVRPLGAKDEVDIDFRLIAATNRDLDGMVKDGSFRKDLLFRIRAIEIKLPPLRDRGQDIQEITIRKIHQLSQRYGTGTKGMSPEFLETMAAQRWPGNVRELINVLEYALASAGKDPILFPKHLPPAYRAAKLERDSRQRSKEEASHKDVSEDHGEFPTLSKYREETEKNYLQILLVKARGDREKACRLSGMSQSRLYGLLKKHNLARFSS